MCRHQSFWRGTKCSQIFGVAQKIWTGTKHFGTCKRTRQKSEQEIHSSMNDHEFRHASSSHGHWSIHRGIKNVTIVWGSRNSAFFSKKMLRENGLQIKPGIQVLNSRLSTFFILKKLWKIKESAQIGFSGLLDFRLLA